MLELSLLLSSEFVRVLEELNKLSVSQLNVTPHTIILQLILIRLGLVHVAFLVVIILTLTVLLILLLTVHPLWLLLLHFKELQLLLGCHLLKHHSLLLGVSLLESCQ